MDEKRLVVIGVGAVLAVSTITILAVTMSAQPEEKNDRTNKTNPLLVISLDGFRSDYIYHQLPTLAELAENGVRALFMMPSYPTSTFPNHYTIVTGLYPESHGIVANSFYDPEYNEIFSMKANGGKWWGGEPMWNTLTRQDKISATYFWPGSDANITGKHPTMWKQFDKSVPFKDRVDQVVKWLSMSEGRPDWVSLYFEEPDSAGHEFGPSSLEVDEKLTYVDGMISRLLSGLRRNNMEDKVNIIVLADHGMAPAGPEKSINLNNYSPDINMSALTNSYGAFTMLRLMNSNEDAVKNILTNLSCPTGAPYIRAFLPKDLPTRFHYSNNRRIGDIVLDFDSGYYTRYPNGSLENGEHGYDNHLSSMNALFIATGPDFKKNIILEPFQNIEIYNLMCHLTGVEPAPNNGTKGALYAALLNPPPTPEVPPEDELQAAMFPQDLTSETLTMANCPGDLPEDEYMQLGLNITESEQKDLVDLHLPWGLPSSGNLSRVSTDLLLLHHQDHVTAYSKTLKMPLWTSYTVNENPQKSQINSNLWLTDVRLNSDNTPTCDSYANLTVAGRKVTMFPLFSPDFSANETLIEIPYLVSNAIPVYTAARTLNYLAPFLAPSQMKELIPYNMMLGPVFDNNADSLPDNFTDFKSPEVPSDIFVVITRCRQPVSSLQLCEQEDLDAISLIVPESETVSNNCQKDESYANLFLATVHDVELATGFTFFPALEPSTRLQLALRIHTNLNSWGILV